jgi:hypothetical protein
MIFPEERYELVEHLVKEYQNGNRDDAGEKLIALFEPLFSKYVKIVKRGSIDFNDYESRYFISLFIADPKIRTSLNGYYQSKKAREIAYKTLYFINSACSQTFEEDLYQELILIFLKFISTYKSERNCFCAYINSSFGYGVANFVKKVLNNPLSTSVLTTFDEDSAELHSAVVIDDVCLEDQLPSNEKDDLDNSWIYGLTCSEAFSELTPFERLILKMSYIDKVSDGEIARKSGYHRNSIWLRRRSIVNKVRQRTRELGMIVDDRDG